MEPNRTPALQWQELGERGWWGSAGATVCLEADGLWHVYVRAQLPPGDSRHKSRKAAMAAAERMLREIGHAE